jgi:hypothetical protein
MWNRLSSLVAPFGTPGNPSGNHRRSSLFREPGAHGAILTEALASRFKVHIHVPTDWDLAHRLGVPRPAVDAAIALNQHLATGTISWAPYADLWVMPRPVGPSLLERCV